MSITPENVNDTSSNVVGILFYMRKQSLETLITFENDVFSSNYFN